MNKLATLFLILFFALTHIIRAQDHYTLTSEDGKTIYGSYEIDNGGYFIRGKTGHLDFHFTNPDSKAEFIDKEISCNGLSITWAPAKDQITKTIYIDIKRKDTTISNVPLSLPIRPNRAPKYIYGRTEITLTKVQGNILNINVNDYIIDDDNDPLTFTWLQNEGNYPQFLNGSVVILNDHNKPLSSIVGITDGYDPITLVLTINYKTPPAKPKFFPEPNSTSQLLHYDDNAIFEGDTIKPYYIRAINVADNSTIKDKDIQIVGPSFGLQYIEGKLVGFIGYDVISDDLKKDEIETPFRKNLTLQATNDMGESKVSVEFKIQSRASKAQINAYKEKRDVVLNKVEEYRKTALSKWDIINADLRKIGKSQEMIQAIGAGLSTAGGVSALTGNVPLATLLTALNVINQKANLFTSEKEKKILGNAKLLLDEVQGIQSKINTFLNDYKDSPETQYSYTKSQMNIMDDQKRTIVDNYFSYATKLNPIIRMTKD